MSDGVASTGWAGTVYQALGEEFVESAAAALALGDAWQETGQSFFLPPGGFRTFGDQAIFLVRSVLRAGPSTQRLRPRLCLVLYLSLTKPR